MNLTKHWAATLDDYVIDLAWSPDGATLAAASTAGPISLFATADGAKRHELPGHENGTNAVAFAPAFRWTGDGRQETNPAPLPDASLPSGVSSLLSSVPRPLSPVLLATGGQDGAVKLWDAAAGQHIATAKLGLAWVEHLAWRPVAGVGDPGPGSPSLATLAASAGRDLFLLNPDGTTRHQFKPAPKTITALAWQPVAIGDGGQATGDRKSNSSPVPRPLSPGSGPSPLALDPPVVAVACFGSVCLWRGDDFTAQKEFPYNNGIHALAWSPDGKWLVSGNQDPSVHLWIPADDAELHMSGYESKVKYLSFDHTSRWLATGGGRDACIWDCSGNGPEGREPAMLPHDAPVCALAFQNTHGLLATASQDGVVRLWSPERQQPLRATVKMPAAATKLAWSPDDRYLAIGSEKGTVYVLKAD
jgi:WD40 repeat protein